MPVSTKVAQQTYTAAVIGVGKAGHGGSKGGGHAIGYTHATMFQGNPRVKLAVGADINAENLKAFQDCFGVTQGFSDYRAMLKEVKPDLVSIGTYVGLHRQMIEDSARAGVRGILCEKPFLASPADLAIVRKVAEETGVMIVVNHMRRYLPAFERARELYNDGTIGKPVICMAGLPNWDLSEWGSHWLDAFRYFNLDQSVKWVMGQARVGTFRGYGHAMEDHAVAYFEFENGSKGLVDGGHAIDDWNLHLIGTAGSIKIEKENVLTIDSAQGRKVESFERRDLFGLLLEDLLQWMEGGPKPRLDLSSMLQTSELNLAAYLSAVQGDRIDLPLAGEDLKISEWPVEILARRVKTT